MKVEHFASPAWRKFFSTSLLLCAVCGPTAALLLRAQTQPAAVAPPTTRPHITGLAPGLTGRRVEAIRLMGNSEVSGAIILNVVRTREGEPLDPATVEEDYQRIYGLKKFANVEAKVEPTDTGVIVVFIVTEQKQIRSIAYRGNISVETDKIQDVVDLREGEAVDRFRIALAKQAVESLYKEKNFPYAHVDVPPEPLSQNGELIFNIVEGPNVRVRKVAFVGNNTFSKDKLLDQIKTRYWIWIFRPGTFNADQIDDDVASIRKFYEGKGFFDVHVGRKLIFSPDQTEMQVNFIIEEGKRYFVNHIVFKGNANLGESELRKKMKLVEGRPYDQEQIERDIREMVRAYSPLGYIYLRDSNNPDYLRIDTKTVFGDTPGAVELIYVISEGKPFHLGRILVKGNAKTQDKVVLREMRMSPGQVYNSGEVQDATDRIKSTPIFSGVNMTPIGDDPNSRDLLVDVTEARTASFNIGAGVNSNGGVGGNLTYEQRNFDITNWPATWSDIFSDRAFVGAGQTFRASIEPGTESTNASLRFSEPYLFDQPYSFTAEAYLRDRTREHYDEDRLGGRVSFGHRFDYVNSVVFSLRGEDVDIRSVEDEDIRAPEIVDLKGHSTLTTLGLQYRRDTTNRGFIPYKGSTTTVGWEGAGPPGEFNFNKFTLGWDWYQTLNEDLLDRKTILALYADTGYIFGSPPFFERFYGGGIGSLRGFRFRGVSPREGLDDDPVGGNFVATGTAEVSFPIAGDILRGVVFSDFGTVESEFELTSFRASVGTGIRLILPFFGQAPLALDFAYPVSKNSQDDVQWISFSFGISQ